jgi:hypothetical protein
MFRSNPNELVLSFKMMSTAIANFVTHGKRVGFVVNPLHAALGDRRAPAGPAMRAAVGMYSVMARRKAVTSGFIASGTFAVGGKAFDLDKALPLADRAIADRLKVSPYGDMSTMTTVVDKSVRDAREITCADAQCSVEFAETDEAENEQFDDVEHVFGSGLKFEFDKLNVYHKGGHFKAHVDTPAAGVLGSLVVVLPNKFTGGELVVRHGGQDIIAHAPAADKSTCFAAFFASCEHEVRPVTSGTRVSLAFKIMAGQNHCVAALAPTEKARIDAFLDQLHVVGQSDTADGVVGVLLTHEYSLGACQRGALVGIDRALFDAAKARFPDVKLTSVIARADYAHWPDSDQNAFRNVVFDASLEEIERIGGMPLVERDEGADDVYEDIKLSGIPFLRANDWHGTTLLADSRGGVHYGNDVGSSVKENVYLHAALIISVK